MASADVRSRRQAELLKQPACHALDGWEDLSLPELILIPERLPVDRRGDREAREAEVVLVVHRVLHALVDLRRRDAQQIRLVDLHRRVHRGAYRAQPSRRVYIPKPDGRQRPLGVAALEDKIVQHAVVTILNQIYEEDFRGFSYGFRPGRSQHQALDALYIAITRKKVNYVLDADIRGFFDNLDRGWLLKFLQHRVADPRMLRLIQKWLAA